MSHARYGPSGLLHHVLPLIKMSQLWNMETLIGCSFLGKVLVSYAGHKNLQKDDNDTSRMPMN